MHDRDRWRQLLAESRRDRHVQPLRICSLCVELLDVDGAGISMVTREGHRGVVCATNDVSARIEDMQFTLGEGPCVDAVSDGHPVLIADLTDDSELAPDRWPTFLADAAAAGVRATFAFPLNIGAIMLGALDLYRHRPGELTAEQLAAALLAADAAALALLELTGDGNDGFGEDGALRSAYHLQVHRASGMLVVQLGVSIEEALLRLRAHAFASGRSLESVATDIVERRLRLPAEQT